MPGNSSRDPGRRWIVNAVSFLTCHDFVSEYELLCSAYSIQSLRMQLWGQLVGMNLDNFHTSVHSPVERPDIKPTIIQTLNCIARLMSEIQVLRHKYHSGHIPRLNPPLLDDEKSHLVNATTRTPSIDRSSSLGEEFLTHQESKSLLALVKWITCDRKKFEEKVKRVKSLIDGLEDISRVAGIVAVHQRQAPATIDVNPPPYSYVESRSQATQATTISRPERTARRTPGVCRLSDNSIFEMLEQHVGMRRYLAGLPQPSRTPYDKLMALHIEQFKELWTDVFDELVRRHTTGGNTRPWLATIPTYHPKRNEARRKLSTLREERLGHLIFDIVAELERRFPHIRENAPRPSPECLPSEPRGAHGIQTRRWGSVRSGLDAAAQQAPYERLTHQFVATQSSYLPFRLSMKDTVGTTIARVLLWHDILGPVEQHVLYVVCDGEERLMGMEERPLQVYKRFRRSGRQAAFEVRNRDGTTVAVVDENFLGTRLI